MVARIAVALFLLCGGQAWGAWSYYRQITVGAATGSTLTDYPALIQLDSSNVGTTLKTAGAGGRIQNTVTQSGGVAVTEPADAVVGTTNTCATKIPWETEAYDGTAGAWKFWTKIASLTTGTNTIFVCYGDVAVVTQQNTSAFAPSAVWDANYKGVWHLTNGATLTAPDSTTNANNGTLVNTPTATAGKIDGAGLFVHASNQYIDVGSGSSINVTGAMTIEAWFNYTQAGNLDWRLVSHLNSCGSIAVCAGYEIFWASGVIKFQWGNTSSASYGFLDSFGTSVGMNANQASHVAATTDGAGNFNVYVMGGNVRSSVTGTGAVGASAVSTRIGQFPGGNSNAWEGWIDEVRVSSIDRSANWIATGYANTNAPLTFNTVGAETLSVTSARRRVI